MSNPLDYEYYQMFMGAGDESYSTVKPYSGVAGQRKKYYYAVARGRRVGIYKSWNQCKRQVKGYKNARYKKFANKQGAKEFIKHNRTVRKRRKRKSHKHQVSLFTPYRQALKHRKEWEPVKLDADSDVRVYTDGGMRKSENHLGAYAFIVDDLNGHLYKAKRAVPNVTNQQMELMALLAFLMYGKGHKDQYITIITDSKYLFNIFTKHWIDNWLENDWHLKSGNPVKNQDILKPILHEIKDYQHLRFCWVKGHANNAGNNRVDSLVNQAMDEYLKDRRI